MSVMVGSRRPAFGHRCCNSGHSLCDQSWPMSEREPWSPHRDKQKFVVGTVGSRSRPIVSRQAHRGDKARRLIRSPVLVVQRLLATRAVGHGFWRDEGTPTFFNTIDPVWILSSRPFDPRVAFYRRRQPISPQMNCRCDWRCGPPVSGGGLVHGGSR